MRHGIAAGLAGLVLMFALCAFAGVKGVAGPASHVAGVEVVEHDSGAPPGFADMVRDDTQKEAALFGADGAAISLKVEIDKVHFKNAMRAMLIGDANYAQGQVVVVDAASGQVLGTFRLWADADPRSAGQRILAALDPTGIVALSQAMSGTNASKEEVVMAENFAREVLRQTYGDARSRAAHAAAASGAAAVPAAAPPSAQPANLVSNEGAAQAAASSNSGPPGDGAAPSGGAVP